MDFLIIYERKNREYENAVLLQLELERRGYCCEIAQFYESSKFNLFNINPPKVILTPHLYESRSVIRTICRFGRPLQIVNLQYEQVLSRRWERLGHHNPKGEAKKGLHVCWGERTAVRLKDAGVPPQNVHIFGALQMDMLRPEFRTRDEIRASIAKRYKLPLDKKWALFLSSFAYADISSDRLKMNENVAKASLVDFVHIHTNSRDELLKWFEEVLEARLDKIFIYRPHPDELALEKVELLAKRYKNFHVIRDGAVKKWIEAADENYSWYSTSVVEAHMLGRSYSILRPYDLPDDFDSVLLKHGSFIHSLEAFRELYCSEGAEESFAIADEYVSGYYYVNPDRCSFMQYSDFLENIYLEGDNAPFVVPILERIRIFGLSSVIRVMDVFRYYYKKKVPNGFSKIPIKFLRSWCEEIDAQRCTQKEHQETRDFLQKKLTAAKW
ncbi:surface carbohydrate biosynthesis protein [Halodesulfovibrio aestuarii]|uniref:surface carbohydrate biosynthesis protein n=1 Tax=Halodesulfovibrio aestuarii TaxID=126333 RepID=UPI000400DC56